ncbi:hypothetical protein N7510_000569 [Penicillium lagena]|uniref:uncharacterized protein n=1 Tax=Penicillium lagena TaxID=94218 RepID=UPI00254010D2|nr:uncharacterized protein N7510_000569 [Penicillium lagena]KAJ5624260.1 hypothetical protein N7510_000569 [Penicillium lagena]
MHLVQFSGFLLFALIGPTGALPGGVKSESPNASTPSTTTKSDLSSHNKLPSDIKHIKVSVPTKTSKISSGSSASSAVITSSSRVGSFLGQKNAQIDGSSGVLFSASGAWLTVACDASGVTDDQIPVATRWAVADAQDAWNQAMAGFVKDLNDPSVEYQPFDAWLWNAFHYNDYPQCWNWDSDSCGTVSCSSNGKRPAEFLLLDSISALNGLVRYTHSAIMDSQDFIQNSMTDFVHTFTKLPSQLSTEILKIIMDSVTFGVGIGSAFTWNVFFKEAEWFTLKDTYRGMWKDIFNGMVAYGMTAGKDSMPSGTESDEWAKLQNDLTDLDTMFLNASMSSLSGFLYDTLHAKTNDTQTQLSNMVAGGNLYSLLSVDESPMALQTATLQLFWGRLITAAWPMSPSKMNPFILRVDRSDYTCGDPVTTPPGDEWYDGFNLGTMMSSDTAAKTQICDSSGNTWFLLNAVQNKQCGSSNLENCVSTKTYYPFQELAGGTSDVLDGTSWGGITIKDIIMSSYGGFLENGGKNGYSMPDDSSLQIDDTWSTIQDGGLPFIGGIQTPGFFNFTICLNATEAQNNAVEGTLPVCATVPNSDGVSPNVNSDGWTPGWCGLHFTQWEPNEGNNNPLDEWQLEITLFDGSQTWLTTATKQPVEGGLIIPSKLTYNLTATMEDSDDSDSLCFWYSDQYWCISDSAAHDCQYDSSFDGTYRTRQGNCGFTCDNPSSDPPASATTNYPTSPVTAFFGTGTAYTQALSYSTYNSGWCGLHIRQYQRDETDDYENPGNNYGLELTLFDAKQDMISYTPKTDAASGDAVVIQGPLAWILEVISGDSDDSAVSFKYGGESWDSSGSQCSVGSTNNGWQDGLRDIDCGFPC